MELLCRKKIVAGFSAQFLPPHLVVLQKTTSTNDYLLNREQMENTVVISEYQSAGRGRLCRTWESPYARSILFSVGALLKQPLDGITFSIATVVAHTLTSSGVENVKLKWPNDIMIQHKKIGGLLIDTKRKGENNITVIGLGINFDLSSLSINIDKAYTDVQSNIKMPISRNLLTSRLIETICSFLRNYSKVEIEKHVLLWGKYDLLFGSKCVVKLTDKKTVEGVVQGINKQGALLLNVRNKTMRFAYGEAQIIL